LLLLLLLLLLLYIALKLANVLELLLLRARLVLLVETVANLAIVVARRACVLAAARRHYRARRDDSGLRALALALVGGAAALGLGDEFALRAVGAAAVAMRRARRAVALAVLVVGEVGERDGRHAARLRRGAGLARLDLAIKLRQLVARRRLLFATRVDLSLTHAKALDRVPLLVAGHAELAVHAGGGAIVTLAAPLGSRARFELAVNELHDGLNLVVLRTGALDTTRQNRGAREQECLQEDQRKNRQK
jgi:hypothetical protein